MNIVVYICIFLTIILSCSCSRYELSINKNVIYTPPTLFSDYAVYDPDLNTCLRSTIEESKITTSDQLTQLFCPAGDITSLAGIEQFPKIESLGLEANKISDIAPLAALTELKQVNLSKNRIEDFSIFQGMLSLVLLDARDNINARCESLVLEKTIKSLLLPAHCNAHETP